VNRPSDSPDLTDPIMRRLGFRRVSPSRARAFRRQRWGARGATLVLLTAVVVLGLQLHRNSSEARTSNGPTLPSAVRHDLLRHGNTISRALRSIRELSPNLGLQVPVSNPQSPVGNEPRNHDVSRSTPDPFRSV